ncbi:Xylose isomerase domain-containing protein TIM barrel OS=Isosphaera pallida (strain ATCC 43644 / DSM 9630 / IS1B) GN=Isop_0819 PE=4 SV=1: AP_endonuc_2 [Gemmataceae bacterium]|nr:Xylose isomerase domain-containing protein TIM barrel OS=Isosphaera pallida (strain ATCC 43644 / DSM 9630 / IS1B) GN=Isop_0819 PE=4 SV=1: AP_endonuc_2 [Gemmataceae bacterium]VTT98469.1 Xylose isomerase domain-containing protein TIM barrel OS=Isosphaera pallida (strain ATCC 43644 / DSM 9630 / IS1B) GN=Isop_0819 PE=4 SV=1: AP_endonuc_2 [Gemmataceae bacterium]
MTRLSRRDFFAASGAALAAATAPGLSFGAGEAAKFKLGLVTYNVPAMWDLPTILKVCQEVGIAAVECRTTHKHRVEPSLTAEQRSAVKKQFADSGVVFSSCGTVCEFHAADPAVVKKNIEDCKQFIGLVKDLGGKGVKVRPNGVPKGADPQKTFEQIGAALDECGKAAADAGVEIWVEVHGAVTQVPKNMKAIMDACPSKAVGVNWNSNPTDVENKSVKAAFELLKDRIVACHINDLENDAKGTYPYRELFGLLKGIGYDRYTMCEVGKTYPVAEGTEYLKKYKELWAKLVAG